MSTGLTLQQTWSIQKLDGKVDYFNRPTIELNGIGAVKLGAVTQSPSDKVTSYWAESKSFKKVVFADSPSNAVWMLIGKLASA